MWASPVHGRFLPTLFFAEFTEDLEKDFDALFPQDDDIYDGSQPLEQVQGCLGGQGRERGGCSPRHTALLRKRDSHLMMSYEQALTVLCLPQMLTGAAPGSG